jgi:hypothetical protein
LRAQQIGETRDVSFAQVFHDGLLYTLLLMKRINPQIYQAWVLPAAIMFVSIVLAAQTGAQALAVSDLPGGAELIPPQALMKALESGLQKPLVLYVGPHVLYSQAHIRNVHWTSVRSTGA